MKKTTLKHSVGGVIHTRTTHRPYTHVLVGRKNYGAVIADLKRLLKTLESEASINKMKANAKYEWKHSQSIIDAKPGDKVFFHRNQGGAYLNKTGPQLEVTQSMIDLEKKYQHDTWEDLFNEDFNTYRNRYLRQIENCEAELLKDHPYKVISWHSRRDLAEKAARTNGYDLWDTKVEAINNGEEAK